MSKQTHIHRPTHTHTETPSSVAVVFVNKFRTFLCSVARRLGALQQIQFEYAKCEFANFRIENLPISSWPCCAPLSPWPSPHCPLLLTRRCLMNVFASHTANGFSFIWPESKSYFTCLGGRRRRREGVAAKRVRLGRHWTERKAEGGARR